MRAHSLSGMRRFYITLALGVIGAAAVLAQDAQTPRERLTPKEIKWPAVPTAAVGTSGAAGLQTVILKGDPAKAGLHTMLLRVQPIRRFRRILTRMTGLQSWFQVSGTLATGASSMKLL